MPRKARSPRMDGSHSAATEGVNTLYVPWVCAPHQYSNLYIWTRKITKLCQFLVSLSAKIHATSVPVHVRHETIIRHLKAKSPNSHRVVYFDGMYGWRDFPMMTTPMDGWMAFEIENRCAQEVSRPQGTIHI